MSTTTVAKNLVDARTHFNVLRICAALVVYVAFSHVAKAQTTETWTGSNNGTWNTTSSSWNAGAGNNTAVWTNGNDAVINGGANPIVIQSAGVTADSVYFNKGGSNTIALYGGTLTLGAGTGNSSNSMFISNGGATSIFNNIVLSANNEFWNLQGGLLDDYGAISDGGNAYSLNVAPNAARTILLQGNISLSGSGVLILNSQNGNTANYIMVTGSNALGGGVKLQGAGIDSFGGGAYSADLNLGGATSGVNFNGGTLQIAGTNTVTFSATGHSITTNNNTNIALQPQAGSAVIINSNIAANGSLGIVKTGGGNVTLGGNDTQTGANSFSGGVVALNYAASNTTKISGAGTGGALTLGGVALQLSGGTTSETVASTTLASGLSSIAQTNSATGSITLGAITQQTGGVINFAAGAAVTSTSNNTGGILGTWATTGSSTGLSYAKSNGTSAISAYSGGTAATASTVTSATTEYTLGGALTLANASTGDTLQYTGAANTLANGGFNLTLNGLMNSGTGSLTISGAGSILAGANKELVITGNTQNIAISSTTTIADSTGGASALTYAGAGTLILGGVNTYTGQTYVDSGTVSIAANSALGAQATGATVNLNGGALVSTANVGLYNGAAGTNNRAVVLGDNGGTFAPASATTLTIAGVVSGNGGLTMSGTGTLSLGASNTYLGGTTINSGAIVITNNNALGGNAGAGGLITLNSSTGGTTSAADTLSINTSSTLNNNIVVSGSSNTFDLHGSGDGGDTVTLNGAISGAGTLVVLNNFGQTLVLNGNMTNFTGTLNLLSNSGGGATSHQLQVSLANSASPGLGNAAVVFSQPSTAGEYLQWTAPVSATIGIGSLSSTNATASTLDFLQNNNGVAGTTATFQIGNLNTSTTFGGTIRDNGGSGGNVAISKVGTGQLTLTGTNSYTGGTSVSSGTLQMGASDTSALGAATSTLTVGTSATAATLDMNGNNLTVGGLSGSGTGGVIKSSAAGNLTVTVNTTATGTTTYAGVIQNGSATSVALTLGSTNVGTLDLQGNNSYTGATTVSGGALQVGGGTGSIGGTSGTALTMSNGASLVLGDSAGTGTATLSSLSIVSGSANIVGGNSSNSTLAFNSGSALSYGGAIGGAGTNQNNINLVKNGTGTLALSGANTYAGSTTINAGGLNLTGAITGSGAVTLASGATLTGGGNASTTGVIGGALTAKGGSTLLLPNASQSLTVNGLTLGTAGAYNSSDYTTLSYTLSGTTVEEINVGTIGSLNSGLLTVNTGGGYITIGGSATTGTTYTLAQFNSSSSGLSNFSLSSTTAGVTSISVGRQTYTLLENSTSLQLQVTGAAVPTVAYFYGGAGTSVWNDTTTSATLTNWSTDLAGTVDAGNTPGIPTDVFLNANNKTGTVSTTLGASTTINSLNVNGNGTNTIAADGSTLTINAVADSTITAGKGINIASGANAFTVNVPIVIGSTTGGQGVNQTWTNASNNTFTVGGTIAGSATTGTQTLTISNSGSGSTFLNGIISDGSGGGKLALNISGTSTLVPVVLGAAETYTGGTTVTSGDLKFLGGSLAAGTTLTVNGGFVDLNGANQTIGNLTGSGGAIGNSFPATATLTIGGSNAGGGNYAGTIQNGSGVVALTKTGTGTETLSGANTFTGATSVGAGALQIANASALANTASITVSSGAALQLSGGITPTLPGLVLNGLGATANQNGALESVSGANSYSGGITLGGTSASIGVDAGTFSVSSSITGASTDTLTLSGAGGTGTLSSTLTTANVASLTKSGASTWVLTGNNTFTGGTTINAGTLQLGVAQSGTTSGALGVGATAGTYGALTIGGGALDLNGYNYTTGAIATTGGSIINSSATSSTLTLGTGNAAVNLTGLSAISGNLTLYITGTNWTPNPTFSGAGLTSSGGLTFANDNAQEVVNNLGTNLGANGTLTFNGNANVTTGYAGGGGIALGTGNGIVVNGTGNSWIFQTGSSTSGAWTGAGTILLVQGFTPTFTFGGNMTGFTGTLQLGVSGTGASNSSVTYNLSDGTAGQIGDANGVFDQIVQSAGNTGTNTLEYSGTTGVTVALGDLNTTGSTPNSGTNQLYNNTSGTVTFQVGALGNTDAYTGNIVNGIGTTILDKVGTGAWTLTGNSPYTGGTTINAGAIVAGGANAVGTSTVTLTAVSNSSPSFYVGGATTIANPISVSGSTTGSYTVGATSLGASTTDVATLSGAINTTQSLVIAENEAGGTLNITGGINDTATTGSQTLTFTGPGNVNVMTNGITDPAPLAVVVSGGTVTLSAVSSYTGGTTVSGGTLIAGTNSLSGGPGAFGDSTSVAMTGSNTPTLLTGGAYTIGQAVNIDGTTTSGAVIGGNTGSNSTFSGLITTDSPNAATGLTVQQPGSGTLTLSGGISGGTSGNGVLVTFAGPGTINVTNVISDGGDIVGTDVTGGNTIFGAANTYSGDTIVDGGTLTLATNNGIGSNSALTVGSSASSSVFAMGSFSDTVSSLSLGSGTTVAGTITGTGTLTSLTGPIQAQNGSASVDLAGTGVGLTKSSAATVVLTGANTYTGATAIQVGVLQLGNGGTTGSLAASSPISISSGAKLTINRSNAVVQGTDFSSAAITGQGSFTQAGTGTTTFNVANSYTGGTTVSAGGLWVTNSSNSATGSGALNVAAGATLGGNGIIHSSSFAIGGTGSQANLIVGNGTDTTSQLTLTGSGSNTINNVTLSFNISAVTPGQGNELSVGTSAIAFSASTLALNVVGAGIIPAYSPYVLIAGTGSNQYSGLTTQSEVINGTTFNVITGGLNLTFAPSLANTWYANHSFLYLNTSGGVDDIEVDVVPEPGTWALMLGGLAMLVFWQRRKRNGSRD